MLPRNILQFSRKIAPSKAIFKSTLSKNLYASLLTRSLSSRVTLETAQKMPKNYDEMPNDMLLTMAIMGDQHAREERLIREIMSVDNCSWEEAQPRFHQILASNRKGLFVKTLPYKIGVFTAVLSGLVSLPMIFDYNTVLWFNELYVTTDVPEAKDLETPLEVGSFAWNWMEPPLGTISFFLLCMQFARAQLQNLNVKPYTQWLLSRRSSRLVNEFPQYNRHVIESFSEGDPFMYGTETPND
mmetsp:Transcript_28632/g.78709  ORF Transcript_28632/g.78709 Transcript_28632/m.78709 type:complete len:242 (+) Transcript_28632:59-784(+)